MTERPPTVRVTTAEELVASLPMFLKYVPAAGDVAFIVLDDAGRHTVTGNIPRGAVEDVASVADQVVRAVDSSGGEGIFIVGYGLEGQVRAGTLRDAMSDHVDHVDTYAVVDGLCGELEATGSSVDGWVDLPDPPVTLVAHLGSPAPSRDAVANGAFPLPAQQVPEAISAQAHAALRDASGPVSMYADEAMSLLAKCGPGSSASTRATFAALIARDVKVRDAVLIEVMGSGEEIRANLNYAARTAAPPDVQNLYTLAGAALALRGDQQPLAEAFLEHGGDLPLARLAQQAMYSGINPKGLREALIAAEVETRTSHLRPAEQIGAERAAARAIVSELAPGPADPASTTHSRNGPAGPGL